MENFYNEVSEDGLLDTPIIFLICMVLYTEDVSRDRDTYHQDICPLNIFPQRFVKQTFVI